MQYISCRALSGKYWTITNESELPEYATVISYIVTHLGFDNRLLQTEMKQLRRYEKELKRPHATCAEEFGKLSASYTALHTILKSVSRVVYSDVG